MKTHCRRAGFLKGTLVSVGVAWSLAAAFLAATLLISVRFELLCYYPVIVATWVSAALLWRPAPSNVPIGSAPGRLALRRCVLIAVCALMLLSWRFSNAAFFYWSTRIHTAQEWSLAEEAMHAYAERVTSQGQSDYWFPIGREDLTKSLLMLGLPAEYAFGRAQMEPSGAKAAQVLIVFGYQSRRWGLLYGNPRTLHNRWRGVRIDKVRENFFYFVAAD